MQSVVHNTDCLEAMRGMPDNAFSLAIVDPPYGMGKDGGKMGFAGRMKRTGTTALSLIGSEYEKKQWDSNTPTEEYFSELKRVSRNQIIWGGNYFGLKGGAIFWDKDNGKSNFSDGEIAYQSFTNTVRKFKWRWHGFFQEEMSVALREKKIHPTQKPVALYKWLLEKYAKPGDRILDTHLGSGSSRIAAYDLGFDFVGYELDADYFTAQERRFNDHTSQTQLFSPAITSMEAAA
jgi:site-specific DNA-methyltransferase (adenine-specific)